MSTEIKYKIIYKAAEAAAAEIDLSTITTTSDTGTTSGTSTAYDLKTFKESLKNLLADNKLENIKQFLGEFVKIAQTQDKLATPPTFVDVNPFVFAIDNTTGDNHKRTYLTFSGDNMNPKVNFNQYSVETTLKSDIETIFNDKLITMNYTGYTALTTAPVTAIAP